MFFVCNNIKIFSGIFFNILQYSGLWAHFFKRKIIFFLCPLISRINELKQNIAKVIFMCRFIYFEILGCVYLLFMR